MLASTAWPALLAIAVLVLAFVIITGAWRRSLILHEQRLLPLDVCVHVNGIRGKSTVTRLVAGVLREGAFVTIAKTTGSAARVIGPDGHEDPIRRRGAPTINEQVEIVRSYVTPGVEALVIECMAVRPLYQQYSQERIVRANITVITNVREDHQEEMGETLEEIADSLSCTIPYNGILISAEDRPHLRERLKRNAEQRGSTFLYADSSMVTNEDMAGFDYLQFKSNVACGLIVADLVGIDRGVALRGMWKAVPDVGVVTFQYYDVNGKRILWIPLFAANDKESVILTFDTIKAQYPPGSTVIGILNNRWDRGRRAELFARLIPLELSTTLDHVITFGAYETVVTQQMVELGYSQDRIHNFGETVKPTLDQILEGIASRIAGDFGVLVGMVNIHTEQAELLLEYFEHARGLSHDKELTISRLPERLPRHLQRGRFATSRAPFDR